jgi:membrane protease YdiL (CAAX protease family)
VPPRPIRVVLLVAFRILIGAAIIVSASILIDLPTQLNLLISPDFPWFPAAALSISFGIIKWSARWYQPSPVTRHLSRWRVTASCVVVSVVLAVFALVLMDADMLRTGRLSLPGDVYAAPTLFRNAESFTLLASAGLIEEAAIRGAVQLGLRNVMPSPWGEAIAGIEFVLIHATRFATRGELPFVILLSLVNGRITTFTQSSRYPGLVHCLANVLIVSVTLFFRQ